MADQSTRMSLNVTGGKEVATMLRDIGLDMTDLRSAMGEVGKDTKAFFAGQVFASRGQVIGEPWKRLSEPYASRKAKSYRKGVLVATGSMQKSFKYRTASSSVTISNDDPKFEWHQLGTNRIPARVMMKIPESRYDTIVAIIHKSLGESIKKRGGA